MRIFIYFVFSLFSFASYSSPFYDGSRTTVLAPNTFCLNGVPDNCDERGKLNEFLSSHTKISWVDMVSGAYSTCNFCYRYRHDICSDDKIFDEDLHECISSSPELDCPENAESKYDPDSESFVCKCSPGYTPSFYHERLYLCTPPKCPDTYTDYSGYTLPLFKVTDLSTDCNFFQLSDGYSISIDPPGMKCCYGQEAIDKNETCGLNELEIDGVCYPIEKHDSNDTEHDCPSEQYWSFSANDGKGGCVPFFPDENQTDNDGSTPDSSDENNNMDNNNSNDGSIADSNSTSDSIPAPSQKDFEEAVSPFLNKAKEVLSHYVLVGIPIKISGSCSNELVSSFNVLGNTYTVDLRPYMSTMDSYLSLISNLIIFMFAFGGVIIVLSSGKD